MARAGHEFSQARARRDEAVRRVSQVMELQAEVVEPGLVDGFLPAQPLALTRTDEHTAVWSLFGPSLEVRSQLRHDRFGNSDLTHTRSRLRRPALDQPAAQFAGRSSHAHEPGRQVQVVTAQLDQLAPPQAGGRRQGERAPDTTGGHGPRSRRPARSSRLAARRSHPGPRLWSGTGCVGSARHQPRCSSPPAAADTPSRRSALPRRRQAGRGANVEPEHSERLAPPPHGPFGIAGSALMLAVPGTAVLYIPNPAFEGTPVSTSASWRSCEARRAPGAADLQAVTRLGW
jgi:hypothetical protein